MIGFTIFTLTIAVALINFSYKVFSEWKGWPCGKILYKDMSRTKTASAIVGLVAIAKTFLNYEWWAVLLVIPVGWLLSIIIINVLKQHSQIIGIAGIYPAFICTAVYISEDRPFGLFHWFFE